MHLCCRMSARLSAADPYLTHLRNRFVDGPKSISKLITYSHSIKDMYTRNRARCFEQVRISDQIRDFAFSEVRYDSESQPMLRICLTFDAVMTTAAQVAQLRGRGTEEGMACAVLVLETDDEACLQFGMMSEAALENYHLTKDWDVDDLDEADVPEVCDRYWGIIRQSFIQGQCVHVPGLTYVMLETLKRPRTYVVHGRAVTMGSVAGVAPEIVTKCLKRMAAWAMLSKHVLYTEVPTWHLMSCFKVFALGNELQNNQPRDTILVKRCLAKTAQVLELPFEQLYAEFMRFRPYALKAKKTQQLNNKEAWEFGVNSTQHRKDMRERYPASTLIEALARYDTWASSTSMVERDLKQTSDLKQGRSEDTFLNMENDIFHTEVRQT